MVAPATLGKADEIVLAVGAVVILAMGVFGLDAIVFRKKSAPTPARAIPKHHVTYIFEEVPDESDADVPRRAGR